MIKQLDTSSQREELYTSEQDEEFNQLQQQIKEKNKLLDEKQKELRYQEHQHKKLIIELNNELDNERKHSQQLEITLKTHLQNANNEQMQKVAKDLEEKLTTAENNIIQYREKELQLNKKLNLMEKELLELKGEKEAKISSIKSPNCPTPKQFKITASPHNSNLKVSNFAIGLSGNKHSDNKQKHSTQKQDVASSDSANQEVININDLMQLVMQLNKEKEELQGQFDKFKESAIDTIYDRDKTIQELNDKLEQQEHQNLQNQSQQYLSTQNEDLLSEIEQFKQEINQLKSEQMQEINIKNQKIRDLTSQIENDQQQHEETLTVLRNQYNERIYQDLQSHIDMAKNMEIELLQQLRNNEEKMRIQEKQLLDSQRIIQSQKEEYIREVEKLKSQIEDLLQKKDHYDKIIVQNNQMNKEQSRKHIKEVDEKIQTIERISQKRDEYMRISINFETENKRLINNIERMQILFREQENQIACLNAKQEELIIFYTSKLDEMNEKTEQEKNEIYKELLKYRELREIDPNQYCADGNNTQNNSLKTELVGYNFESFTINRSNQENIPPSPSNTSYNTNNSTPSSRNKSGNNGHRQNLSKSNSKVQNQQIQNSQKEIYKELTAIKEEKIQLENELCDLKKINNKLVNAADQYEKEMQKYQNDLKVAQQEIQMQRKAMLNVNEQCYQGVASTREAELISENESLKSYLTKMETHFLTSKLQWAEETNFLKQELKYAEKIAADCKLDAAQLAHDRDFFQFKYKKLSSKINKKKQCCCLFVLRFVKIL